MNYYELVGTYILKGGGRLRTKMLTNLQIMTYIYVCMSQKGMWIFPQQGYKAQ